MFALVIFLVFLVIAVAGVPLMYALLATTVGMIWVNGLSHPLETIFLSFIAGVEPFILIAVPLFIFGGNLLVKGGVGKRIVAFAGTLFGWLPGGLAVVTTVSCLLFGGVSGSAIADTAAIGSLVVPMMKEKGYHGAFAAALLSVAGTLALLMPLSIPFLVYAFISGVSMRQLSMSGVVPAIIIGAGPHRGVHVVWERSPAATRAGSGRRPGNMGRLQGCGTGAGDAGHHHRRHLVRACSRRPRRPPWRWSTVCSSPYSSTRTSPSATCRPCCSSPSRRAPWCCSSSARRGACPG